MNLLAHAYLSFNQPELLVGNMISDHVKGKKKYDYSAAIQQGIDLHRKIDEFTDASEATKQACTYLRPAVGLYAGVFVDIIYDHFLANDANEFTAITLPDFVHSTYKVLNAYQNVLPEGFKVILPYMQQQNWLVSYSSMDGIEKSFTGIVRRARYLFTHTQVFELFTAHYYPLQNCYNALFPALKAFATNHVENLRG